MGLNQLPYEQELRQRGFVRPARFADNVSQGSTSLMAFAEGRAEAA
jgi:hypothetical protein